MTKLNMHVIVMIIKIKIRNEIKENKNACKRKKIQNKGTRGASCK